MESFATDVESVLSLGLAFMRDLLAVYVLLESGGKWDEMMGRLVA